MKNLFFALASVLVLFVSSCKKEKIVEPRITIINNVIINNVIDTTHSNVVDYTQYNKNGCWAKYSETPFPEISGQPFCYGGVFFSVMFKGENGVHDIYTDSHCTRGPKDNNGDFPCTWDLLDYPASSMKASMEADMAKTGMNYSVASWNGGGYWITTKDYLCK